MTPIATGDLSRSQSVDRALRLLALVGREAEGGAKLSDIVEDSGLNKPTARRLLLALMRAGLIEQEARRGVITWAKRPMFSARSPHGATACSNSRSKACATCPRSPWIRASYP